MLIKVSPDIFNASFLPLYEDESRYLVLKGGAGSGKSRFAAQKILFRTMEEKGHRFFCVRKVGDSIRKSQYKDLMDLITQYKLTKYFKVLSTEMSFVFKPNGNEIFSLGIDSREKIKSLSEPTGLWLEEPTELDPRDFRQINLRLRGTLPNYKQSILTFNPISEFHWLKERFFLRYPDTYLDKHPKNTYHEEVEVEGQKHKIYITVHHSTYRDNKFMDIESRADLERLAEEDPHYYEIYGLGHWGSVGNLVYQPYVVLDKFPETYDEIIYGLDFGYFFETALVRIGIKDDCYYVEELIYEKKLTNDKLIEAMMNLNINRYDPIYADAQESAKIEELNRAFDKEGRQAFNVKAATKGPGSVKDGIDFIKRCRMFTLPVCVNLIKERNTYKWKEDSEGNPIEGEVLKRNDHLMDAERYAIYTHSNKYEMKIAFIRRESKYGMA